MVRGGEHEDALVVGLSAIELGEQLVDEAAARGVAHVAALLAERVELVEEEHARRRATGGVEGLVELALALAQVHVEHVVEAEREERRAELPRDRAGEERLAAAGWSVEQQAAAQRLAVVGAQLGVAQGRQERRVQPRLDLLEAADVGERHPRSVDLEDAVDLLGHEVVDGLALGLGVG
jgi:hypothetical protein